ncbi:MAG: UbiD family decarboxylase [Rhodospirillales bacterium]|jgi:4-hydroxy-3-polyprenylbenzoate decarboxylase|nr:UbiD family decarboxylase [Rhodospirillales bacterium]MDP6644952.1 UbiD family decarboxylase [Rhodospirillales bacterium]MDP6840512.1 UbiD family decarboxylase [Rhodospirillales bacterium]
MEQSVKAARGYRDLPEHIAALRDAGLLIEVSREINKDTEMHPLVRWQYRGGVPENARKAWLFTNVIDAKGRRYEMPVLVGGLAGSRAIYQIGMDKDLDQINDTWLGAIANPIPPSVVGSDQAPCQEIVIEGEDLMGGQGLDALPVPISTPGWDNAPYLSSGHFITKDPGTGVQNVGIYRAQLKAPNRLGMNTSIELRPGGFRHWQAWKELGQPMPCAVAIGCPPAVSYGAVQKVPLDMDEIAVVGGLVGAPINVACGVNVDLMVPAESELIIEGFVDTEYLEPEGPFGESHGHVNLMEYNGFMNVTAITRKVEPVFTSIISQVTPSESSVIKRVAYEPLFLGHLRDQLGIRGVISVSMHEPLTNIRKVIVIKMEDNVPRTEVWRALYGTASLQAASGKYVIAVNGDIDPDNTDAIFWAMSYRAKPHRDIEILKHKDEGHGPRSTIESEDSAVLIDATLKETFPPVSLPKREFMERAADIWHELGLPELKPEAPWHGYDLGEWTDEMEAMAVRATDGDYWETGRIYAQRRRGDIDMNTEIRALRRAEEEDG